MERITTSYEQSMQQLGARRVAGHQHWEADMSFLGAANIFYLTTLAVLRWFMQRRAAYDPKLLMQLYNVSCVVLAAISGIAIAAHKWQQRDGTFVCNKRGAQLGDTKDGLLTFGIYFYYYQKYWEFMDTFIFMLRKSDRQVTFLHIYHHSSITLVTMLAAQFDTSGDTYLPALLNSWIHVLMYGHYFLTSIGVKNAPWRKYLTSMQLLQFLAILAQNILAWFKGADCGFPDWYKATMMAYMISMLVLFSNFYVQSYSKPKGI
jgi:hypothetical protein